MLYFCLRLWICIVNYMSQFSILSCQGRESLITMEEIRQTFDQLKQHVRNNRISKVISHNIDKESIKLDRQLQKSQQLNDFQTMNEIYLYQDKYRRLKQTLTLFNEQKQTEQETIKQIIRIFEIKDTIEQQHPKEVFKESEQPKSISKIKEQVSNLEQHFLRKELALKEEIKNVGFKNVIRNDNLTQEPSKLGGSSLSPFKRKRHHTRIKETTKLLEENKKLHERLQKKVDQEKQLNEFQKNLLREEKNHCMSKIDELENEIESLYRDNYRLKEIEKQSQKGMETFSQEQTEEIHGYTPYVMKTRNNDLKKISHINHVENRNNNHLGVSDYLGDKLHFKEETKKQVGKSGIIPTNSFQISDKNKDQFMLGDYLSDDEKEFEQIDKYKSKAGFQQFPQYEQPSFNQPHFSENFQHKSFSRSSLGEGANFETFEMAKTHMSVNSSILSNTRKQIMIDSTTATRNKVAFFKQSLVLVRNQSLEIAFKRSNYDDKISKVRIIFYFNNKTNQPQRVNVDYDFEPSYFSVSIKEKLQEVGPKKQGREVIEVTHLSMEDLNSIPDVHMTIGRVKYDIWLPVCFIQFQNQKSFRMVNPDADMIVVPDRQFSDVEQISKVVPFQAGGVDGYRSWGYIYGKSKVGCFPVKLTWENRELTIETTSKWIHLIGFIMHFFK